MLSFTCNKTTMTEVDTKPFRAPDGSALAQSIGRTIFTREVTGSVPYNATSPTKGWACVSIM